MAYRRYNSSLWVNDHGNNNKIEVEICRDCEKRVGNISLEKTHKDFKIRRGGRTDNVDIQMKRDVFSVTHKALLRIDDDKRYKSSVDEMHARQGLMTHLTTELYLQLQRVEIEGEDEITDFLIEDIKKYIEETEKIKKSPEFKKKGADSKKAEKEVEADYKKYTDAIANGLPPDEIDRLCADFEDLATDRDDIGDQPKGYMNMCKIVNGGKELLEALQKSKKRNSFNKVVFVFMKALKLYAGDIYRGHDVHKLTAMQGMRALEHRQKIYDIVVDSCNNDEEVVNIMKWWLEYAGLLYLISLIMKSQEKLSDEKLNKFKDLLADYVNKWIAQLNNCTDKNPIFRKLHMILCGLV